MKIYTHKLMIAALATSALVLGGTADAALIGHYTFDSDANDSAGSRNGTVVGNATFSNSVAAPAPSGSSGSLDLTNGGHIALASSSTATFDEYTIAMWVKVNEGNGFLSGLYTTNTFNPGAIHLNHVSASTPNRIEASIGGFGTPGSDVPGAPTDWIHVAIVHQTVGGGTQLFINGVEADSANTGGPTQILDASQIGDWAGQDRQFNGWIDDVRIYDELLTDGQIEALAGVPEPGSLALLGLGGLLIARRRRGS